MTLSGIQHRPPPQKQYHPPANCYDCPMEGLQLTAVYMKVPEGYIASIEELPGANTQGATLDEARANLNCPFSAFLDYAARCGLISSAILFPTAS
jgi:hypothetical protein